MTDEISTPKGIASLATSRSGKWYVDVAVDQAFPLLHDSQAGIDSAINRPIDVFGIGQSSVRTFQNWRRDGLLLTPLIGAGYECNQWLSLGSRAGAATGQQSNERRLLTGFLDADFEYSVALVEVYGFVYPLKRPEPADGNDFVAALKGGRPFFSQAISVTRFVQVADVSFPTLPFAYKTVTRHDDVIPGYHPGLGWEWAIATQWSVRLSGNYSFYFDRSDEFNGFGTNIALAFRF